jgi:predicted amidohydrolase YtcJ
LIPVLAAPLQPRRRQACAQPAADLAVVDGKLWTLDERQPEAEALAVWHDRILAVGSSESIRRLVGRQTRVIALHGRRVLPGFHDCHVHLLSGGLQLGRVDLKDAADEAEFGRRLKAFDRLLPPGRWLLGGNWDHDRTFAGKLPTAALLDRYVRPALPWFRTGGVKPRRERMKFPAKPRRREG